MSHDLTNFDATELTTLTDEQIARKISVLGPNDGEAVVRGLIHERAARVLGQLDSELAGHIVSQLPESQAARILELIDPDDRVDILGYIEEEKHARIVAALDASTQLEVSQLEQYPPDTAGGLMSTQVTALEEQLTVDEAISTLRKLSERLEQLFYSYVIDREGRLVGVLSMRDMILARPHDRLHDIMIRNVVTIPVKMDQEEVARAFRDRGLLAMPVVDDNRRLIGVITADDIVDVMAEEANEDVLRMFGAGVEEKLTSSWQLSYRKRVGWLAINLATAFAGAAIISRFQGTIASLALLAAFMPVVSAVGGNASVQAMAVTVRGLTQGKIDRKLLHRVLKREAIVGLIAGISIGALMFLATILMSRQTLGTADAIELGLVVASALAGNLALGCIVGTAIPVLMSRLGFDPAQSATIFTTAATDAVGFFLLLGLASWLLL